MSIQLLPPAVPGVPLFGNLFSFQKNAVDFLAKSYEKNGPIFSMKFGPKHIAVLIGKENNQFFFNMTDKMLSIREVYQWMIPVFGGDDYTMSACREKYLEQRKTTLAFFTTTRMPYYVASMEKEVGLWIESLGVRGEFDMCQTFANLLMRIAARAFVGSDFRDQMGEEFRKQYEYLAAGVEYFLPTNLPIPRFWRRDAARKKMNEMVSRFIDKRRNSGIVQEDTLQFMMEFKEENGCHLSNEAIVGLVIKLVFAGHETTQSQLTWALIQLLQNPFYIDVIRQEQAQVFAADSQITEDKLKVLSKLTYALKETERMKPISLALMRHNMAGYERGGFHIPKGWMTMISPLVSHRIPEDFPYPHTYNPERFSPEQDPERLQNNSLCGFGGGSHKCFGMNFAYTNMKVILTALLRAYNLELVNSNPLPKKGLVYQPEAPCMVRYERR